METDELASKLRSSFLEFTKFFYPVLTGRDYIISNPLGRESHHITIARALTQACRLEIPNHRLLINVSPGSGKSTMLSMWIAWTMATFPDARFLYISYSKVLASKHTETIKRIMQLSHYQHLFNVRIRHDSKAREYFQTTNGGAVAAFGSGGAITGQDAGLPGLARFSGAVIIDDAHKPDEVHSDTIRISVIDNYRETIQQRARGINVPFIFIGQRLHEDDLGAYLINQKDGYEWHQVILKSIDEAGNALYPEVDTKAKLLKKQETDPYVFASQYQQNPIPAGGALFKPEWFVMLDEEPDVIYSFITCDTAETSKSYNDATAFSFWGIYEIESYGIKTGQYGLHWIDTLECRIEPKDLKDTFLQFWAECMRYKKQPQLVCIEKKSTGGTLLSLLDEIRTVRLLDIPRTREQGNKTKRFLATQPYIAERRVSFPSAGRHVKLCIEHMSKITANETHRWDDVCYVRNTIIATTSGNVNIQDIKIGDSIITPFGIGIVTTCGLTGEKPVIKNIGLEGTPNHPIFYKDNFIPLISIIDMINLDKLSFMGLFKWKQRQLLYSMEENLDFHLRESISVLAKENIKTNFFTVLFGNFIQKKKYQKTLLFTIKTIINLIIVSKIWSYYRLSNIAQYILRENPLALSVKKFLKKCGKTRGEHNPPLSIKKKNQNKLWNGLMQKKESIVVFVRKNLLGLGNPLICVAQNANAVGQINGIESDIKDSLSLLQTVYTVKKNSQQNMQYAKRKAEQLVQVLVQDPMDIKEVYNLKVEPYGVYYANGILVSNCDTAADAVRIALIEKTLVASQVHMPNYNEIAKTVTSTQNKINRLRKSAYVR